MGVPFGYEAARQRYLAALGELIITWNQAENTLRTLLHHLSGGTNATHILTAELGALGIFDGLRAIGQTLTPEMEDAVVCVAKVYNGLREYRNYYVHGVGAIGLVGEAPEADGLAYTIAARGQLRTTQDVVTFAMLGDITRHVAALRDATGDILDVVHPIAGSRVDPPLPSLQTLPLPDRLEKTSLYPLANRPPP